MGKTVLSVMCLCSVLTLATYADVYETGDSEYELMKGLVLKIGIGPELLYYQERSDGYFYTDDYPIRYYIDSNAATANLTLRSQVEYFPLESSVFIGVKGGIPVVRASNVEKWETSMIGITAPFQTNDLKYGWLRVDPYIGYSLEIKGLGNLNPYIGMRYSRAEQDRTNFVALGEPQDNLIAIEKIDSYGALLGVKCVERIGSPSRPINFSAYLEGVVPFGVEVTNTAISGPPINTKDGYTAEAGLEAIYHFAESLWLDLEAYGGFMRWAGSEWVRAGGMMVKWPENNTVYLGGTASLILKF